MTWFLVVALCYNFVGILVVRMFLGLVESIIGPVFVIVTSKWWTRSEQAFRTAFWLGGTPVSYFLFTECKGVHRGCICWEICQADIVLSDGAIDWELLRRVDILRSGIEYVQALCLHVVQTVGRCDRP